MASVIADLVCRYCCCYKLDADNNDCVTNNNNNDNDDEQCCKSRKDRRKLDQERVKKDVHNKGIRNCFKTARGQYANTCDGIVKDRKCSEFCDGGSSSSISGFYDHRTKVVNDSAKLRSFPNWQLDHSTIFVGSLDSYSNENHDDYYDVDNTVCEVCSYQQRSMMTDKLTTNFEKLVQRLETATLKLETLSSQKPALAPKPAGSSGGTSPPTSVAGLNEAPQSVVLYDEIVGEPLQNLLKLSAEIGGDVQEVVQKLLSLFTEQRNFIWSAAGQKEPSANELQAKLSTIVATMCDISTFRDSKRNTSHFHHISAISEGAQAIGWLTVKPTPAPFIKDMTDAAMFFINRVFKECKDDQVHTNWAKAWAAVLNSLQKYVRQAHTTGLTWNSSPGTKPLSSTNSASASAVESLGGPPPPPPMLPPDLFTKAGTKSGGDKADRAALFAELSTGENVTQRLKKVTDDMKTHKNPELRANSGVVESVPKDGKSSSASLPKQQQEQPVSKLPRTWLEDFKRWNVEYYKNDKNIVIEVNMKQAVYIYKCENCVVQIKGKVNTITMDSSKKTSIVFESSVSQVEIINCQSVQIQTLGAMPLLSIQKTDGCQVYLSKEAMNADIITSKSSEMNVLVPAAEDDDFVEYSVPEQFKTIFDGKQLRTTVSEIV